MKKILTYFASFTLTINSIAQENITSIQHFGGNTSEEVKRIKTDASGNYYVVGGFAETTDFDPSGTILNISSQSNTLDGYVSKFNSAGDLIWVHQFSGPDSDIATDIVIDNSGNTYIGGHFFGSLNIDPGVTNTNLTSNGDFDAFLVKLDQNGTLIWGKNFGSAGGADDFINSLAIDASNNIYIGGLFNGTGDFDPGVGVITLSTAGDYDGFISKFSSSGDCLWASKFGGANLDEVKSIFTKGTMVYVTGSFKNTVDFDFGSGTANLSSSGDSDVFILKMSETGAYIWAKKIGGTNSDSGQGIAVGMNDEVYTIGTYTSLNTDFDPGVSTANMSPAGGIAGFISKLDNNGLYVWSKQITGSVSATSIQSICLSPTDEITLGGSFSNQTDFDPSMSVYQIQSAGANDGFVAKYSSIGEFISAHSHGGLNDDFVNSVAQGSVNELFVTGTFTSQALIASNPPQTINAVGNSDVFILKYEACSSTSSTDIQEHCSSYTWIDGQTYTSNNNTATFTTTNQQGCDSIITLNLTILNLPSVGITINGENLTANEAGANYQWIDCATNSPISGETNQSFTATSNGNYSVIVDNGSCVDTSLCVPVNGLGIKTSTIFPIEISPNPTTGFLNVFSTESVNLQIVSIYGEKVLEIQLEKGNNHLNIENFENGVYFFYKNNQSVLRVIKQ